MLISYVEPSYRRYRSLSQESVTSSFSTRSSTRNPYPSPDYSNSRWMLLRTRSRIHPTRQGGTRNRTPGQPRRTNDAPRLLCSSEYGIDRRCLQLPRGLRSQWYRQRSFRPWRRTSEFVGHDTHHKCSHAQPRRRTFLHSLYRIETTHSTSIRHYSLCKLLSFNSLCSFERHLHPFLHSARNVSTPFLQLRFHVIFKLWFDLRFKHFQQPLPRTSRHGRSYRSRSPRPSSSSPSSIFRSSHDSKLGRISKGSDKWRRR